MSTPRVETWSKRRGAEPGGSPSETQVATWYNAQDFGPALPMAAALSRHESMAGLIASQRGYSASLPALHFQTIGSQQASRRGRGGRGSERALRLESALDGVVWLANQATIRPDRIERLYTPASGSIVPVGRRASMVPAGVALRHSLESSELVSDALRARALAPDTGSGQPSLFDGMERGQAGDAQGAPFLKGSALAESYARSGLWLGPDVIAQTLERRSPGSWLSVADPRRGNPPLGRSFTLGEEGISEAVSARWLSGDGSEPAIEAWSPRTARQISSPLGYGVYASGARGLDLAMVGGWEETAEPTQERVTPSSRQVNPVHAMGADSRLILPVQRAPDAELSMAVLSGAPEEGASRLVGARRSLGAGSERGLGRGPQMQAFVGFVSSQAAEKAYAARKGRAALKRPIPTAREILAVESLGELLQPPLEGSSQNLGIGPQRAPAALSDREAPLLQEPLLSTRLRQRMAGLHRRMSGALHTPAVESFAAILRDVNPHTLKEMERTLRRGGWTEPELSMLKLGHEASPRWGGDKSAGEGRRAGPTRSIRPGVSRLSEGPRDQDGDPLKGQRALEGETRHLGAQEAAVRRNVERGIRGPSGPPSQAGELRTDTSFESTPGLGPWGDGERRSAALQRMTRNLARIITQSEAMNAPESTMPRSLEGVGVLRPELASTLLTANERYFAENAPQRGRVSRYGSIFEAVRELVALSGETSKGARTERLEPLGLRRGPAIDRGGWSTADPQAGSEASLGEARDTGFMGARGGLSGGIERFLASEMPALGAATRWGESGMGAVLGDDAVALRRSSRRAAYDEMGRGEATYVGLDVPAAPPPYAQAGDPRAQSGLAMRVSEALDASSSGPAGANRLLARDAFTARRPWSERGTRGAGLVSPRELQLAPALAPETMLRGMRAEALRPDRVARRPFNLFDGGRGTLLSPTERSDALAQVGGSTSLNERALKAGLRPAQHSERPSSPSKVKALLAREASKTSGLNSGLMHALITRLERTAVGRSMRRGEIADFTMAWLDRVDGGRTGVDLGLDGLREEVVSAVGSWARSRRSRLSVGSPIEEARTVSLASRDSHQNDRSGLRKATRRAFNGTSRARRPTHQASAALRETDWKFVDTGSRESTPHADLGSLAAKIMDSSPSAGAAPMPLVAPAVKAVAQTALRKPRDESVGTDGGGSGSSEAPAGPPGGDSGRTSEASKSSKAAFEKLALEMADRVARRLKREQERKGQWP